MWHLEKEGRTLKINQLTFQKYLLTTLHFKTEDFFLSGIIPSKKYKHLMLLWLSIIPSYSKKKKKKEQSFNCLENKIGMFWLSFFFFFFNFILFWYICQITLDIHPYPYHINTTSISGILLLYQWFLTAMGHQVLRHLGSVIDVLIWF